MTEIDDFPPTPIEFAPIKRAYLHHLETGESPTLEDLMKTTPPSLSDHLLNLVSEIYITTGQLGALPTIEDELGINALHILNAIRRAVREGKLDPNEFI